MYLKIQSIIIKKAYQNQEYKCILYYKVFLKTIINHDSITRDSYDKNILPEEHGIKCFVFVSMFLIEPHSVHNGRK